MHACNAIASDQFLSLRDGEPVEARVAQHANSCAACLREVARLRHVQHLLRELPEIQAPVYDRATFVARLSRPMAPHRFRMVGAAALAAGVGVFALLIAFANRTDRVNYSIDAALQSHTSIVQEPRAELPMSSLVIRSQDLESRLQRLPQRPRVERASTAATIDSLQSRIQWVDYQLSLADDVGLTESQSTSLWQDRVQLMDTLVKVRSAEVQRFAVLQ